MTSDNLTFDLTQKTDLSINVVMIFDALSNAAYHVSLRGPGAELEGALKSPPPLQQREALENLEAQQGTG